jgi:hypothetical protein
VSRALLVVVLALAHALAAPAFADDAIRLAVGDKVERDVGYAIGVACDQPDIVTAEMKTAPSGKSNILVLTGKRAGITTCRAGTDPHRVSFVFSVVVTAPRRASRSDGRAG